MTRHLVMLSGGADSAKALLDAIEMGGDVCAYHVVLGNSCRKDQERRAARSISNYAMANLAQGRITFKEAIVTVPGQGFRDLLFLVAFAHAEAAMESVLGAPYSDIWFGDGALKPGSDFFDIDRRLIEIFRQMCDPSLHRSMIEAMPTIHSQSNAGLTKQQARDRIGETLWSMTWGCRMPENGKPCGKCFTCKERAETHATSKA